MLVAWARPKKSPLHEYFEWNDEIAGERFRETQALQMILASKFVVFLSDQGSAPPLIADGTPVRKLLPTLEGGGFKMRYEVLEEKDSRAELIEIKKTQLRTWCREAIDIEELSDLRKAVLRLL